MKTYHKTLTDEQVLKIYSQYSRLYWLNTKKTLQNTTIEEAMKEFDFNDMFFEYVNQVSKDWTEEQGVFWDDHMDMFDVENYFVPDKKIIGESTWIKLKTTNGYELHLAKRSLRKRRWNEVITELLKQSTRINIQIRKKLDAGILDTKKLESKSKEIKAELDEAYIRRSIGIPPYEVKIRRTKTTYEYLLPFQYEIMDVEETVDNFVNGIKQITIKSFFNSDNKDKIFYLRTRGIPEKIAIVLSSLKDCYFKIDIASMWEEYNQQIRNSFQVISK